MARSPRKPAALNSVHPGVQMMVDRIAGLKAMTGRSLDEWVRYIQRAGPEDEAARGAWLKDEVKPGTNIAWWLAERSVGKSGAEDTPEG